MLLLMLMLHDAEWQAKALVACKGELEASATWGPPQEHSSMLLTRRTLLPPPILSACRQRTQGGSGSAP